MGNRRLVAPSRRRPIIARARSKGARLKPLPAEPFYLVMRATEMVWAVAVGHAPSGAGAVAQQ